MGILPIPRSHAAFKDEKVEYEQFNRNIPLARW